MTSINSSSRAAVLLFPPDALTSATVLPVRKEKLKPSRVSGFSANSPQLRRAKDQAVVRAHGKCVQDRRENGGDEGGTKPTLLHAV